ncbi:protein-glutamate O-methyltransferase CheR [Sphingopyxis sp. KK2]|uniref:CheR family methyltransferase n=1 Tax=Sphingopyxis sp. KK2 TaxID=1855727 RepID=UPI00097E6388|nr:protein-glutamate O-methyltransferase CheR [Sphingopyxis sp. KK2]
MTAAPAPAVALTDADIAAIGAMLYRWTGMIFGANKRYYIERRIADRMGRLALTTPSRYFDHVSRHLDEREALINAFTINETYFYREDHQLAAMSRDMLPEIVRHKKPGDHVRIWSMPCSTGEESYSIALWLLENWALVDAYHVEIVGSDIDTAALDLAREGRFSARSLAKLPRSVLEAYFEPEHHHKRRIIGDLRESVRFTNANIIDPGSVVGLGRFDIILCRNLLIYFDDGSRLLAANNLHGALADGGYLCLGHSESMTRISDRFEMVRFGDAIVYRRR